MQKTGYSSSIHHKIPKSSLRKVPVPSQDHVATNGRERDRLLWLYTSVQFLILLCHQYYFTMYYECVCVCVWDVAQSHLQFKCVVKDYLKSWHSSHACQVLALQAEPSHSALRITCRAFTLNFLTYFKVEILQCELSIWKFPANIFQITRKIRFKS